MPTISDYITLKLKSQSKRAGLTSNTAHRPPDGPVGVAVVGRVNASSCEVQVVGVVTTVDRTRPIERSRAWNAETTVVDVAGPHKP